MNIYDLIFPLRCIGCSKWDTWLCEECVEVIRWASYKCPMCAQENKDGLCHKECESKFGLEGLWSIYEYEGLMQKIIKAIKYRFCQELIEVMLGRVEVEKPFKDFLLVPIPLHWYRENWRGFNQARIMADILARDWQVEVRELLIRKKATKPVAEMAGEERVLAVKGIFEVKGGVKGKRIVLVDDVFTTGSTMREATKVLKKAGARAVWGFTLVS